MVRAVVIAALALLAAQAAFGQEPGILHIRVVLIDPDRGATPVPNHALLVSDNPATASPRRVVTGSDGTAVLKLRAGNYTVESDQPVAFHGKAYQWTQILDIAAGRDATLELTADNAETGPIGATAASAAPAETDPAFVLPAKQEAVVALWTPETHASGFLIDKRGLILTNQRVLGTATSVEVQLTPTVKVAGSVLVAEPEKDVAVLAIDPAAVAAVQPLPLPCTPSEMPPIADGQKIFVLSSPLGQMNEITPATVTHADAHAIVSDFELPAGSTGGPVLTVNGIVVGITSISEDSHERRGRDTRVVRASDACEVVASAEKKMTNAAPPSATHLPVDPLQPFPADALKDAAAHRGGGLSPYSLSSSGFDIAFITPVMIYGAQHQPGQAGRRAGPLDDFGNWSEYVDDIPPVLLVRVTPKQVEGFWTTVARGAAQAQGMSIPSIKRFKSGFLRMRAFCGDAEVTPIHPFKIERRVTENEGVYEGLYAFEPGALTPQCGTVKLTLYSEKEPVKEDSRIVDPKVVQQIWQDFEAYRSANR